MEGSNCSSQLVGSGDLARKIGDYKSNYPQFGSNTVILVTMNEYNGGSYAYPNVENWPVGSTKYRVQLYNISVGALRGGFRFVAYQND